MIHVDFVDFNDMVGFARQLIGQVEEQKPGNIPEPPVQAAAPVPTTPVQAPVQPAAPVPVAPVPAPVPTTPAQVIPTSQVSYTADDLARAAMALMDSGRQADLVQLLASFGVESLPALRPEQYGPFATALRGLGAQI
ncbi:MAG: hypothetical protein MRZ11_05965 [Allisonella histaminiformans]|uniref:hypothetical protein n=1 Tax=Allisonella histaminiformans TaxID=209880 RepID=UPI00235452BD|nr:hypothetical protein [Allisonella histaminiformans]MCI6003825.1 hypothetical protein [Allisonella histaminiformans]